eukprot:scaffold24107_cov35-Prasinocladus_malaysianus.AAC.2
MIHTLAPRGTIFGSSSMTTCQTGVIYTNCRLRAQQWARDVCSPCNLLVLGLMFYAVLRDAYLIAYTANKQHASSILHSYSISKR